MAKLENTFKKYLMKIMGTRWDADSIETKYLTGIPDIAFGARGINGWIELKQVKAWPKREDTIIKPEHYTAEQVNWLSKRGKKGGNCFVMVRVGADDYFIFTWPWARMIQKGMDKGDYMAKCDFHWKGSIVPDELLNILVTKNMSWELTVQ